MPKKRPPSIVTLDPALLDALAHELQKRMPPPLAPAVYTLPQFCEAHGLKYSTLYKLRREGKGPRISLIGSKPVVRAEDAREWAAKLPEAAAQAGA